MPSNEKNKSALGRGLATPRARPKKKRGIASGSTDLSRRLKRQITTAPSRGQEPQVPVAAFQEASRSAKHIEKLTLVVSLLTAIIAATGVWVSWRQASIANGQLREMKIQREAEAAKDHASKLREAYLDVQQRRVIDANETVAGASKASAGALARQLDVMASDQRPRIEIIQAEPASALTYGQTGAAITIRFTLRNSGRGVAGYAFPYADFYPRGPGDSTVASVLKRREALCERVRHRNVLADPQGVSVYGGGQNTVAARLRMTAEEVEKWRTKKADTAPMLVGCIDYIADGAHYQTPFILELDRYDRSVVNSGNPFQAIDPTLGDVAASDMALAVNPFLATRPD